MSVCSKYLYTYLEKNNSLESLSKQMQLSPLHKAVIERSLTGVRACLEMGADVNARDVRQWTPLHHASVLGYKKISRFLKAHGADPMALTDTQATATELRRFVVVEREKKSRIPLLTTALREASTSSLTHRQYRILTGTFYLLEPLIPMHFLIKEWHQGPSKNESLPFINHIQRKYEEFLLQLRIPHILQKAHANDEGQQLLSSPGLGLFASQDYSPGVIIGEYLGRVSDDNPRSRYNLAAYVDGSQYSNEMTRINDGFPNVVLVPLANIHGLSTRYIFITSSPIKKGEQFCWNYGDHSVKLGPYSEMRPAAIRNYIKEIKESGSTSFGSKFEVLITKLVIGLGLTQKITLEEFMEVEKLRYLLETPAIIFNLVFEGVLDDSTAQRLWQAAYFPTCLIPPSAPKELKKLVTISIEARNYYKKMQNQDPLKAIDFQTALAENMAKKGILATLAFVSTRVEKFLDKHPREGQIRILIQEKSDKRKAIFGIGRKLTIEDLGKRVLRTAPLSLRNINDWSYVPNEPTTDQAMKESLLLVKLEGTTFLAKDKIAQWLQLDYFSKIPEESNDGNWMLLEEYQEFIEKFPLDQFPQEKERIHEEDPEDPIMSQMRDYGLPTDSWDPSLRRDNSNSHVSNSKIMELLNWPQETRKQLPTLQEDYLFKVTEKEISPSSEISSKEKAARKMLKISSDEYDLKKIGKQFRKLALKMHPDKGGDPRRFKELNEAYQLVLKKLDQRRLLFKIDANSAKELSANQAEEIYEQARNYLYYLREELRTSSRDVRLAAWEKYDLQIESLTSLRVPQSDGFFEEMFERLVANVRENVLYLKFRQKLETLEQEFLLHQNNSSEKAAKLENVLKTIKKLEEEFDLSNQRNSWIILEQRFFIIANLLFQDRIMAFERTLAEVYLRQENDTEASEVRLRAIEFYSKQKTQSEVAIIKAKAKNLQTQLRAQKRSTEKSSPEAELDPKLHKTEQPQGSSFADENAQGTKEAEAPKKDDISLIFENIAKNAKFFSSFLA